MADVANMPQYDGMDYEELVASAQYLWLENAKLLELCVKWFGNAAHFEADGRKLRELCADVLTCVGNGAGFSCDECPNKTTCEGIYGYEERARELGVEVD